MSLRFYIIFTGALFVLLIPGLALGLPFLEDENTTIATVHGVTYAWDTLEPINDTVIEVNSTPPQSIVAKNGTYSFKLISGEYIITASYYQNNTLVYSKETTIRIEEEGDYVMDLLLYPASENGATGTAAGTYNPGNANPAGQTGTGSSTTGYLPTTLTLLLVLGIIYKLSRSHKNVKKNTTQKGRFNIPNTSGLLEKVLSKNTVSGLRPEPGNARKTFSVTQSATEVTGNSEIETVILKEPPLSEDLREIIDVIRIHKGRITQKDLRGRLEYSEVKVSLLLSELEKRGLIKKFKNGRENIVILTNENDKH